MDPHGVCVCVSVCQVCETDWLIISAVFPDLADELIHSACCHVVYFHLISKNDPGNQWDKMKKWRKWQHLVNMLHAWHGAPQMSGGAPAQGCSTRPLLLNTQIGGCEHSSFHPKRAFISCYNSVSMERFLPQSIICSLRIESACGNKVSTPTQQHHVCATNSFIYLTLLQIQCFDNFLNINPGSSPVSVFLQCSSV